MESQFLRSSRRKFVVTSGQFGLGAAALSAIGRSSFSFGAPTVPASQSYSGVTPPTTAPTNVKGQKVTISADLMQDAFHAYPPKDISNSGQNVSILYGLDYSRPILAAGETSVPQKNGKAEVVELDASNQTISHYRNIYAQKHQVVEILHLDQYIAKPNAAKITAVTHPQTNSIILSDDEKTVRKGKWMIAVENRPYGTDQLRENCANQLYYFVREDVVTVYHDPTKAPEVKEGTWDFYSVDPGVFLNPVSKMLGAAVPDEFWGSTDESADGNLTGTFFFYKDPTCANIIAIPYLLNFNFENDNALDFTYVQPNSTDDLDILTLKNAADFDNTQADNVSRYFGYYGGYAFFHFVKAGASYFLTVEVPPASQASADGRTLYLASPFVNADGHTPLAGYSGGSEDFIPKAGFVCLDSPDIDMGNPPTQPTRYLGIDAVTNELCVVHVEIREATLLMTVKRILSALKKDERIIHFTHGLNANGMLRVFAQSDAGKVFISRQEGQLKDPNNKLSDFIPIAGHRGMSPLIQVNQNAVGVYCPALFAEESEYILSEVNPQNKNALQLSLHKNTRMVRGWFSEKIDVSPVIEDQDPAVVKGNLYQAEIFIRDERNVAIPGVAVELRADSLTEIYSQTSVGSTDKNNKGIYSSYLISRDVPVILHTNSFGKILFSVNPADMHCPSFFYRTLEPSTFTALESGHIDVSAGSSDWVQFFLDEISFKRMSNASDDTMGKQLLPDSTAPDVKSQYVGSFQKVGNAAGRRKNFQKVDSPLDHVSTVPSTPPSNAMAAQDAVSIVCDVKNKTFTLQSGTVSSNAMGIFDGIADAFSDAANAVGKGLDDAVNTVVDAAKHVYDEVSTIVTQIGDEVTSLVNDIAKALPSVGQFFTAIYQLVKCVVDEVINIVEAVIEFIKMLFDFGKIKEIHDMIQSNYNTLTSDFTTQFQKNRSTFLSAMGGVQPLQGNFIPPQVMNIADHINFGFIDSLDKVLGPIFNVLNKVLIYVEQNCMDIPFGGDATELQQKISGLLDKHSSLIGSVQDNISGGTSGLSDNMSLGDMLKLMSNVITGGLGNILHGGTEFLFEMIDLFSEAVSFVDSIKIKIPYLTILKDLGVISEDSFSILDACMWGMAFGAFILGALSDLISDLIPHSYLSSPSLVQATPPHQRHITEDVDETARYISLFCSIGIALVDSGFLMLASNDPDAAFQPEIAGFFGFVGWSFLAIQAAVDLVGHTDFTTTDGVLDFLSEMLLPAVQIICIIAGLFCEVGEENSPAGEKIMMASLVLEAISGVLCFAYDIPKIAAGKSKTSDILERISDTVIGCLGCFELLKSKVVFRALAVGFAAYEIGTGIAVFTLEGEGN